LLQVQRCETSTFTPPRIVKDDRNSCRPEIGNWGGNREGRPDREIKQELAPRSLVEKQEIGIVLELGVFGNGMSPSPVILFAFGEYKLD